MRFLSLFSGIEAASVAWLPLGWQCAAVAEVDKFCNAVLAHHYPTTQNLGDVTKITEADIDALGTIDLLVFGFPCQDVSVAGLRKGFEHNGETTRSGLFHDAMRIAGLVKPRWTVVENVPGLFSSNAGRDFACVVGALAGATVDVPQDGWQNSGMAAGPLGLVEWAVLDAQFFGVPQRRRRIFIVRDSGNWFDRPPLLLESESLSGHNPPSRETLQGTAPTLSSRTKGGGGLGTDCDCDGGLIATVGTQRANGGGGSRQDKQPMIACPITSNPYGDHESRESLLIHSDAVSMSLNAHGVRMDMESESFVAHALRADGFDGSEDGSGRGTPLVRDALNENHTGREQGREQVGVSHGVRRLTPT